MRKWTPSATDDAIAQDKALLVQAPDFWFNRYFWCKALSRMNDADMRGALIRVLHFSHHRLDRAKGPP